MTPDFALSLSFDGIRLFQRIPGGWALAGEVSLETEDLNGALYVLRQTAEELASGSFSTKLIIPNDQIKYLTLNTGEADEAVRWVAGRAALDGATPYAVDDLAFDVASDGPRTYVAAVARETLLEAETFAQSNGFNPVCFVACPDALDYVGEPFFGETACIKAELGPGVRITRDTHPIRVTGPVIAAADKIEPTSEPEMPEPAQAPPDSAAMDVPVALAEDLPPSQIIDAATGDEMPAPPAEDPEEAEEEDNFPVPAFSSRRRDPETAPPEEPAPVQPEVIEPAADVAQDVQEAPPEAASIELSPEADSVEPAAVPEWPEPEPEPVPDDPLPPAMTDPVPDPTTAPADDMLAEAPPATAEPAVGFASRRGAQTRTPKLGGVTRNVVGTVPRVTIDAPSLPQEPLPPRARPIAEPESSVASQSLEPQPLQPEPMPAAVATADAAINEADRLTVFGARSSNVGGRPKYLGLTLTVILLLFLAGMAAFASVFVDDGIMGLFRDRDRPATETTLVEPVRTEPSNTQPLPETTPNPELSVEDEPVPDARPESETTTPDLTSRLDQDAVETRYAATGIWPLAPTAPVLAPILQLDDLYEPGIDRGAQQRESRDAVALPTLASLQTDTLLLTPSLPAAPGQRFTLDSRGLVIATLEGTLNPDGIVVYAGRPPAAPGALPDRDARVVPDEPAIAALRATRPKARPDSLVEDNERANFGGNSRAELASYRPVMRPEVARTPEETIAEEPDAPATKLAVRSSLRPDARPRNFNRIVARALKQQEAVQTAAAAPAPRAVAPRTVTPSIPSSTAVAKAATARNVLNLRDINLIGVFGKPSDRRAFVRLSNGRIQRVGVGDKLDGGQVLAIGESELRYQKRGRNVVLKMPRG